MQRQTGIRIKRHENGLIAVEQATIGDFNISFNPDDDRYYVTKNEDTIATFNLMRNAVYYARTH